LADMDAGSWRKLVADVHVSPFVLPWHPNIQDQQVKEGSRNTWVHWLLPEPSYFWGCQHTGRPIRTHPGALGEAILKRWASLKSQPTAVFSTTCNFQSRSRPFKAVRKNQKPQVGPNSAPEHPLAALGPILYLCLF